MKVIIGTITGLITIVGAIIAFDNYYAHAYELKELEQNTVETFQDVREQMIADKLNDLIEKEAFEGLNDYEKVRKERLEKDWEQITK